MSTYDHRYWKARDPVCSPLDKPVTARPVVGWLTTSESLVLYVFFVPFELKLQYRPGYTQIREQSGKFRGRQDEHALPALSEIPDFSTTITTPHSRYLAHKKTQPWSSQSPSMYLVGQLTGQPSQTSRNHRQRLSGKAAKWSGAACEVQRNSGKKVLADVDR